MDIILQALKAALSQAVTQRAPSLPSIPDRASGGYAGPDLYAQSNPAYPTDWRNVLRNQLTPEVQRRMHAANAMTGRDYQSSIEGLTTWLMGQGLTKDDVNAMYSKISGRQWNAAMPQDPSGIRPGLYTDPGADLPGYQSPGYPGMREGSYDPSNFTPGILDGPDAYSGR